jgi:hypothetical protein
MFCLVALYRLILHISKVCRIYLFSLPLKHLETVTRLAVQYFSLDEVTGQINTTRLSQLVFHVVQRTLGHQTTEGILKFFNLPTDGIFLIWHPIGFDDLLILRPVVSLLANMNAGYTQSASIYLYCPFHLLLCLPFTFLFLLVYPFTNKNSHNIC